MKHIKTIKSSIDEVWKYQFLTEDKLLVEFSFIDKNDGKHIICAPSSTGCSQMCEFCHVTEISNKIINRRLRVDEYADATRFILSDRKSFYFPLLISFMGVGEPFINIWNISKFIEGYANRLTVRFAICSSFPRYHSLEALACIKKLSDDSRFEGRLKLHVSIHSTSECERESLMPFSTSLEKTINDCRKFRKWTSKSIPIEFHHTFRGTEKNDDIAKFYEFIAYEDNMKVKFLKYNDCSTEKPLFCNSVKDEIRYDNIKPSLDARGIKHEYYVPPGQDIGSSCGQLSKHDILKYNKNNKSFWEKLKINIKYMISKEI